ncbi:MAG: hypothetical protein HQ512_06510 [Rhodospirillales bacterium]|nr:hypothetical protein [Rhodospirillales bacterium]
MRKKFFAICVLFLFSIFTPPAQGADIHDFNEGVSEAYKAYREAMFYLRTGNPAVASFELEKLDERWKAVVKRFADKSPDVFSRDPAWRKTLLKISERTTKGLQAAIDGDAKAANKHLKPIRKILSDLRRRNGVSNFSDCIDQANAAFNKLNKYRKNPPDFGSEKELDTLRQKLSVTIFWYERCWDTAPPAIGANPEFKRLMKTSLYSLSRIWVAIASKDKKILTSNLAGLSSSDKILYLRFG